MKPRNGSNSKKMLTSETFLREEGIVRLKHLTLLEKNYQRLVQWVEEGCHGSCPLYFLRAADFENLPDLTPQTVSIAASQGLRAYWQRVWPHLTPTPIPKVLKTVYPRWPSFKGLELRG